MEPYKKLTGFDIIQKPIVKYEILVNNIVSAIINKKTSVGLNVLISAMNYDINEIDSSNISQAAALKQSARRGIMNIGIGYVPKLHYLTKEEIINLLKKEFNNKAIINDKDGSDITFMIHKQDFFRWDVQEILKTFFDTHYIKDVYCKLEPLTVVYTTFHIIDSKKE